MEDRREAGYVITNGNPTGTERKTESKTENKMGNVNGSGIVMGTPADLEVSGIKFHYGKREILKGTGFQARRGEVCLLLGANGAGKTTLLKCINGLLKASDGTVKWLGKDTAPLSLREKARIFGYGSPEHTGWLKPYSYGNGYFRPSSVFNGKNRKSGCGKKCPGARAVWSV